MRFGTTASSHTVPAGGGGIAFRSADYAYETSSDSEITVNKPSGVISGDMLVMTVYYNGNGQGINTPSGWTYLDGFTSLISGATHSSFYKKAGGSEPSTYTITASGTTSRRSVVIAAFSGSFDSDPTDSGPSLTTSNASSTGITTVASDVMVIYLGGYDEPAGNTWGEPTGWTSAAADDGSVNAYIGYKLFASAGATGTISYTNSGNEPFNTVWGIKENT